MKQFISYKLLPILPAAAGILALILRLGLYTMENERGLLPHNHPLYMATLILAVVTALLVGFFVSRLDSFQENLDNLPASRTAAIGSVLTGICLVPVALQIHSDITTPLDPVWAWMALVAAVCLMACGRFQWKGKQPHFILFFIVCLYFALHMVCRYREWSGNPQVEDYIFAIFGCICLALFSYYRAAFCVGYGRRRMMLFSGMMALFFCLSMLISGNDRGFFLAGSIWAATNQCVIDPPKKESKEE